ncbi:hypothetical protein BOTBODRAFT_176820 [Botryobasidium botryosum FD-172 SS1]|uniref:DUF6532 domain-containing protein n=1 Tax=Botryobasidium botryosum (strain FD-172 SS1) TaxID=930990 RepID=A0A067MKF2_BOTB1|nr:hypothetical protein BOTBODRAFT_176820 [Botryobasidium botryosum FD-172 SS1]
MSGAEENAAMDAAGDATQQSRYPLRARKEVAEPAAKAPTAKRKAKDPAAKEDAAEAAAKEKDAIAKREKAAATKAAKAAKAAAAAQAAKESSNAEPTTAASAVPVPAAPAPSVQPRKSAISSTAIFTAAPLERLRPPTPQIGNVEPPEENPARLATIHAFPPPSSIPFHQNPLAASPRRSSLFPLSHVLAAPVPALHRDRGLVLALGLGLFVGLPPIAIAALALSHVALAALGLGLGLVALAALASYSQPDPALPVPEDAEPRLRPGNTGGGTKQGDYEDSEATMIKVACQFFTIELATVRGYPEDGVVQNGTEDDVAAKAWAYARLNAKGGRNVRLNSKLATLIKSSKWNMRNRLAGRARSHIQLYGINATKSLNENRNLVTSLLVNYKFIFADPEEEDGLLEHPAIIAIIKDTWFDKGGDAAVIPLSFNPLPIPLIALTLTAIHYAFDTITDGPRDKGVRPFAQDVYMQTYGYYRAQMEEKGQKYPAVMVEAQQALYAAVTKGTKLAVVVEESPWGSTADSSLDAAFRRRQNRLRAT